MTSVGIVANRSLNADCLERALRERIGVEVVGTYATADHLDTVAREFDVVLVDHSGHRTALISDILLSPSRRTTFGLTRS